MTSTKEILQRRTRLKSEEKKLASELEDGTVALESSLKSSLKTLAMISAGALTLVAIYHLLSSEDDEEKEKKQKEVKVPSKKSQPSPITAAIFTTIIQKLLPLAIERFSKASGNEKKNA